MKNQIIYIRGGENFDTKEEFYEYLQKREYNPYKVKKSWRDWIAWALSDDFEVLEPQMPNKQWVDYTAWKIWFEKLYPYLGDGKIIVIGSSLGAAFLMKYLSENLFPKKIDQLHFVAPTFDNTGLIDEKIGNMQADTTKLGNIEQVSDKLFLYHSTNDIIVPVSHSYEYQKYINFTKYFEFKDRGHFDQPSFPELLQNIHKHL